MNDIEQKISASFAAQGMMQTLGAQLVLVADGEVRIALPFSRHLSQQHGFVQFQISHIRGIRIRLELEGKTRDYKLLEAFNSAA